MRPGVSTRVRRGLRLMRCCDLVTAGSSPTLAIFFFISAFISVDLPTLGMPMIISRSGLKLSSRCGASFCASAGSFATSPGFLAEMATAFTPGWRSKYAIHAAVAAGSARSLLFRTLRQGRCRCARSSWIMGLLPASGTRASSTSITTSISAIVSAAFLRAAVMWPGNHWIAISRRRLPSRFPSPRRAPARRSRRRPSARVRRRSRAPGGRIVPIPWRLRRRRRSRSAY